jgi:hypothetical protein
MWKFLNRGISTPIAIGIITILVIIVGGFALWQRAEITREENKPLPEVQIPEKEEVGDETAEWQTYRNEEYGFEFKYPPVPDCGFCKIDQADEEGFTINRTSVDVENLEGLTLSEFVDKKLESIEMIESREEILVDGEEGISVAYRFGGTNRYAKATFIEKNNEATMISFSAGGFCCPKDEDKVYELEVYDAIISTFKFIEEETFKISTDPSLSQGSYYITIEEVSIPLDREEAINIFEKVSKDIMCFDSEYKYKEHTPTCILKKEEGGWVYIFGDPVVSWIYTIDEEEKEIKIGGGY